MSGPIQGKIHAALKAIAKAKNAADFSAQPDNTKPTEVNTYMLECQLERCRREIRMIESGIDDLRSANSDWTDLLRKMSSNDREAEKEVYYKFQKDRKLSEKTDEATDKLQSLRDIEVKLAVQAKIYRNRAEREERAEKLAHARALQEATQAAQVQQGQPQVAHASLYQLPIIQLEKFNGQRNRWTEFIESFRAAVDGRAGTKAEKLNLLRGLLEGEPRALIAGLRLENRNYDIALRMLMDTYGAKEEHIRDLHL